jgi:hypothetical protein
MSLDVWLTMPLCEHCGRSETCVYEDNITHNLGNMAEAAGIYEACWHPEDVGIKTARQLIEPLRNGVEWLRTHERDARKHDAANGWGLYEHFLPWVERYLAACEANPEALVSVSR